ncbi:MAG: RNA methyltransferase [Bacteroidia bacterium]
MLSKNQIKQVTGLQFKKNRALEHCFVAEGAKIVPELLRSKIIVRALFGTADFFEKIFLETIPESIEKIIVSELELKKISSLSTPNEVLAVCEIPVHSLINSELKNQLSIVLDDVRDPGNLGTIVRIADWFGIANIICSPETVDVYNPKVIQATMGSIARVNVCYMDLKHLFSNTTFEHDFSIYGAVLNGENVFEKRLNQTGFIVIGNESKGISEKLLPHINEKISIPSFSLNQMDAADSLNAAIATAVLCAEFRRRK